MLFYHRMYLWKRGSIKFSYFPSLAQRDWDLRIPSTKAGTRERWDPALELDHVTLFRRHIAQYPMAWVQPVPSISHIPWHADQTWSSFAQECVYLPTSLFFSLAGLKICLSHKGSLIMLPHQGMLSRGESLFFKVIFLSLCQASGEGFKELPGGNFRKWLILFAEILSIYKTSMCNLVVMSLSIYSHYVKRCFSSSFSLPLPSLWVFYFSPCASTCTLILFLHPYSLPPISYSYWKNCECFNYLKNCS